MVHRGAILITCATACAGGRPTDHRRPDILLVSLDTVRWDHTSVGGYRHDTTPHLAAFARLRGSVLFTRAYTDGAWSQPAYVSLFTGQHALSHGVGFRSIDLDPGQATLASMLSAHGYATRAFVSGPHLSPTTGIDKGFDDYGHEGLLRSIAGQVDPALDWLTQDSDRPRLAFVQGYDAHTPYSVPAAFSGMFEDSPPTEVETCGVPDQRCLTTPLPRPSGPALGAAETARLNGAYDAAVAYADHQLGRLLHGLQTAGRLDDTLVIVLADHGEMLGEGGGLGHDLGHSDAVFHVPLVVRLPVAADDPPPARAEDRLVSLSDLLPTLSALLEMTPPSGMDGVPIPALLPSADPGPAHPHRGASMCCYYVREGTWSAAAVRGDDTLSWTLFADGSPTDRAAEEPARLARMQHILGDWPTRIDEIVEVNQSLGDNDPTLKKALQDGGYWHREGR